MATLSVQDVATAGLTPAYVAANSGGDDFAGSNGERTFIHVKNGHSSPQTVNVVAKRTSANVSGVGPVTIGNLSVSVTNAQERMIGPISDAYIGSDGKVNLTYSGVTSLTLAVLRLPRLSV